MIISKQILRLKTKKKKETTEFTRLITYFEMLLIPQKNTSYLSVFRVMKKCQVKKRQNMKYQQEN